MPLGLERGMPTVPAVVVAERLWKMEFPFYGRMRFADVRFSVTDADFTVGQDEMCGDPSPGHLDDAGGSPGRFGCGIAASVGAFRTLAVDLA